MGTKGKLFFLLLLLSVPLFIASSIPRSNEGLSGPGSGSPISFRKATVEYKPVTPDSFGVSSSLLSKPIPTNKIWSSVVFEKSLKGLFTYPFAAQTKNGGLALGIPLKTITSEVVTAQLGGNFFMLTAKTPLVETEVTDFSEASVSLSFKDDATELLSGTFVQGSPYVFLRSSQTELELTGNVYQVSYVAGVPVLTFNGTSVAVFTDARITPGENGFTLTFPEGVDRELVFGYLPSVDQLPLVARYASNTITGVSTSFGVVGTEAKTVFSIDYAPGSTVKETLIGLLPHQYQPESAALFTASTIRGEQRFNQVGSSFTTTTPALLPELELSPAGFSEEEKGELLVSLTKEVGELRPGRGSSYFGGKDIARTARLAEIAHSLGYTSLRDDALRVLRDDLEDWFTYTPGKPRKYFQYDTQRGGMIAIDSEFDSSKYSDHHYHYGYFLYASAVLGQHDQAFVRDYSDIVDAIASDIATYTKDSTLFPTMRSFDFFEGHSWASGVQSFEDGNNQESTSEAINAWYGMYRWALVSGDQVLKEVGMYLYSNEVNATKHYWLNHYNNPTIFPAGYLPQKATLVWGGKYEYNTFFNSNLLAKEGIEFLPFTAGSTYLFNEQAIERDYRRVSRFLRPDQGAWLDINYMYYAMVKGKDIAPQAVLESIQLDGGNSRSNLLYWVYYWESQKK